MKKISIMLFFATFLIGCSIAPSLEDGSYTLPANKTVIFSFPNITTFTTGSTVTLSGNEFTITDGVNTVTASKDGTTDAYNAVHETTGQMTIGATPGTIVTNTNITSIPGGLAGGVTYTNVTIVTNSLTTNNARTVLNKVSQIYKATNGGVTLYFAVLTDSQKLYISPVSGFRQVIEAPTYWSALTSAGSYAGAFGLQDVTMYYFADKQ